MLNGGGRIKYFDKGGIVVGLDKKKPKIMVEKGYIP